MLSLLWCSILACSLLSAQSAAKSDVCSACECRNKVLDCSNRNLSIILPLEGRTNATTIIFDKNVLTHVPRLSELSVKILSLAQNEITDIEDSAFQNLISLVVLDLSSNLISASKLLPSVFRGHYAPDLYEPLRSLKELNIANNMLHSLRPDVFEHLPNLEKLNLKGNPLSIISHGTLLAITSITFLKELDLSETGLKQLPESLLHVPKHLESLNLSNNAFATVPQELENSHRLRWLSLNGNPMRRITHFPRLQYLKVLHLSHMTKLIKIEKRALSTLPRLEEFYCSHNHKLVSIDNTAFSAQSNEEGKGEVWPPLKTIILRNCSLNSIESHLIGRWDHLDIVDVQNNPWMCDCENQWLVSTLAPMIEQKQPELLKFFKCAKPTEMEGLSIVDLHHRNYEMRCLDLYDHKPEKDGKLLIDVCILAIIMTPFIMFAILYYKRYRKSIPRNQRNASHQYTPLNLLLARKFNIVDSCQKPAKYRDTAIITLEYLDLCKTERSWSLSRKALLVGFFTLLLVLLLSAQIGILYYKKTIKNQRLQYQKMVENSFQSCHYNRLRNDMLFLEAGGVMMSSIV